MKRNQHILQNNGDYTQQIFCLICDDMVYIEAKYRNDSVIKDTDGIVVYGMKNTPGYVITKNPEDYGICEK